MTESQYLAIRSELSKAFDHLKRLQEQRSATLGTAAEAGRKWRDLFKSSAGNASRDVRDLQGEERTMAAEAEQLDELIAELTPRVQELKTEARKARAKYQEVRKDQARQAIDKELSESVGAALDGEAGKRFLGAVAALEARSVQDVLDNASFMVGLGFGAHDSSRPGFMSVISGVDRAKIHAEAERRTAEKIAGLILARKEHTGPVASELEALSRPLPTLECEH